MRPATLSPHLVRTPGELFIPLPPGSRVGALPYLPAEGGWGAGTCVVGPIFDTVFRGHLGIVRQLVNVVVERQG